MKLKGAGPAWIFGILSIMLVSVIFYFGANISTEGTTKIVLSSAEVYSTENSAEFLKSLVEGMFYYEVEKTPEDLGKEGGGYTTWKKDFPTKANLLEGIQQHLISRIDKVQTVSNKGRQVIWEQSDVSIVIEEESYVATLQKPFEIESSIGNPQVNFNTKVTAKKAIASGYLTMLDTGIGIANQCSDVKTGEFSQDGLFPYTVVKTDDDKYSVSISENGSAAKLEFTLDCSAPAT